MRRVLEGNSGVNTYEQRDRFNRKHSIYTWLYGGSVGAVVMNAFVMIIKVTPEVIDKALNNDSHSLFTFGNNVLAIGLAVEGVTAAISGKKSSTYGKRTAELDGSIASYHLVTTQPPKQLDTDAQ